MRMRVVGAEAAVHGFALAGVRGDVAASAEELHTALAAAMADNSVAIILLTEDAASLDRTWVDEIKLQSSPLIVEIPGPAGPDPDRPSLSDVVQQMTGVRI